jgi:hypothetical protein
MTLPHAGALLAGSFVLLQAVDFCLTHLLLAGVRPDVYEANPLATHILKDHGWLGLGIFKLLCTLAGLIAVGLLWRQCAAAAQRVLVVMCLIMVSVVVYSGTLLAGSVDPAADHMSVLRKEANIIAERFDRLRKFEDLQVRVCEDYFAGRDSLDEALARMGQCLEVHTHHLLSAHRDNLPKASRKDHVAAYLYLKVSTLAHSRIGAGERLMHLRQTIHDRYPDLVLLDFSDGVLRSKLPWVAHTAG